jgi:hypothetical protein
VRERERERERGKERDQYPLSIKHFILSEALLLLVIHCGMIVRPVIAAA